MCLEHNMDIDITIFIFSIKKRMLLKISHAGYVSTIYISHLPTANAKWLPSIHLLRSIKKSAIN